MISDYKEGYQLPEQRFACERCAPPKPQPPHIATTGRSLNLAHDTVITVADRTPIHRTIFNERFAIEHPTKDSDYRHNFMAPEPTDYRKKRTQTLLQKRDSSNPY